MKLDHREIGKQLDLFMFHESSPGCPIWLPNGNFVYSKLSNMIRNFNQKNGYVEVRTPVIWKPELYDTSGHLQHYSKNMLYVMGQEDQDYCSGYILKPMNCPSHMIIFKSKHWSYKDLPYRIHDQGMLHRNEDSGAIGGLTRCRAFCQDDAHIFITPEKLGDEIKNLIRMVKRVYEVFNMAIRTVSATRPEGFIGEVSVWDAAEKTLKDSISGDYKIDAGGGAFYGPKIDFYVIDSQNREWQTATIQLDFQLPQRFELSYVGPDNLPHTPIVIHRAIYGSFERLIGILLEHTQGHLPLWLAPIQGRFLPINTRNVNYCKQLMANWNYNGCRFDVDDNNDTVSSKVRIAESLKIPHILVVGDREEKDGNISDRSSKTYLPSEYLHNFIAPTMYMEF